MLDLALQKRIRDKSKENADGCWIWQGHSRGSGNYGGIRYGGKNRYAHRASYKAFIGEIPEDGFIHHTCGTRLCVNPEHLQCTTWDQNYAEMAARKSLLARISELEAEVQSLKEQLNERER